MKGLTARQFAVGVLLAAIAVPALYLAPFVEKIFAATCTWSGGSGAWETAGNWTNCGGGVPGGADDAIIDANITVTLNASTTVNSLTLGNSGGTSTPTLNFNYDAITNGALIIDDGNLTIYSGAIVTHTDATNGTVNARIYIDIQTGDATITGTVTADNKGNDGGPSTGGNGYGEGGGSGTTSTGVSGAGGGYGGKGAPGEGTTALPGGVRYGDFDGPVDLGSGGGGVPTYTGASGGGAIQIDVVGSLTVDGIVSADGQSYISNLGGAGSGGSVYINTTAFSGSGSISSNGGNGRSATGIDASAGGGGRIAIKYSGTNSFSGTITANMGGGNPNNQENGTVVVIDTTNNDLYIDNSQIWESDPSLEGSTHLYRNVEIDSSATLQLGGYYTNDTNGVGFVFSVTNFTVGAGSTISGNGLGYRGGKTYGANGDGPGGGLGTTNSGQGGSGGSYGGLGHRGDNSVLPVYPYGDFQDPVDLGSGGGARDNGFGANGGGVIKVTASGTVTVNGNITMDGENFVSSTGGAGSGGSINIAATNILGSGIISANGGNGSTSTGENGGGGSGGRIALKYSSAYSFSGTVRANAGGGNPNGGENGTAIILDTANNDLYVRNSQFWRADPLLEGSSYPYHNITITNSATLYAVGYYTNNSDGVGHTFNVNNFTIDAGASVSANGLGYKGGSTYGADGDGPGGGLGTTTSGQGGSGGSYGGYGHRGDGGVLSQQPYGDYADPIDLGSGGGARSSGYGADGGGAIIIKATDTVTINGSIRTNGENFISSTGGAGSGGCVNISAQSLAGTGLISANGGDGSTSAGENGGGGSGGRIVLKYSVSNTYSGTIQANVGGGNSNSGESGTIITVNTTSNDLYIQNTQVWRTNIEGSIFTYRDVYLSNNATLYLPGYYTTNSDGFGVSFYVDDLVIEAGSSINVNGFGYRGAVSDPVGLTGDGPGGGEGGGSTYGAGGGYGGKGADYSTNSGGSPYGSERYPMELGSGGGSYTGSGGNGGGAVRINSTGTVSVDGGITANGNTAPGERAGSGSGGSICIITGVFTGSGTITATGGPSGYRRNPGGGGRISILYHIDETWTGSSLSNTVATASGGSGAYSGTVVFDSLLEGGEFLTRTNVADVPPDYSINPFEDPASTSSSPVNVGSSIAFRATADDLNADNYYLAVCKTNSVIAGSPPTCVGGHWCRSIATTYGTEATCSYQSLSIDDEVNVWYGFVCDEHTCSTSSQGSGDSGSPFEVNHAPTIAGTTAGSANPQGYGSGYTITVNTTASDADTSGTADTLKVVVCMDNSGATASGCNGADDLCSSSLVASNPSCSFDIPMVKEDGNYNYYAYVFDNHDFGTNMASSTYTVNGTPPIVTSVTLNSGSDITLNDQNTGGGVTSVALRATVTDYNSCQDLSTVTGYVYRTGIGYAGCTVQDNNNCYYNVSCSVDSGTNGCTGNTDETSAYLCTVSMQYHADPTDGATSNDSPWYDQSWKGTVKAVDGAISEDTEELITGIEVNSTTAFSITTVLSGPKIGYGEMALGADSGLVDDSDTNQISTITATGNVGLDQEISGTVLSYSTYAIPIANQKHSFSSFTYSTGGTVLSASAVEYEQNCLKTTATANPATAKTYWGILMPTNSAGGAYSGTNYLNGVKGEASEW